MCLYDCKRHTLTVPVHNKNMKVAGKLPEQCSPVKVTYVCQQAKVEMTTVYTCGLHVHTEPLLVLNVDRTLQTLLL